MRADIYLINGSTFSDMSEFCLRLCDKAYKAGHEVHIRTEAAHESETLDRFLWEGDKESFLPHQVLSKNAHQPPETSIRTPITISHEELSTRMPSSPDLVILMNPLLEDALDNFKRVTFIIPNTDTKLELARAVYRQIKNNGTTVNIHDLRR